MKTWQGLFILAACLTVIFPGCEYNQLAPGTEPVIQHIDPDSGRFGTKVTINGDNFAAELSSNRVTFNGQEAEIISATNRQLEVVVPRGAGTGPVEVTSGKTTGEGPVFRYITTVTVRTWAGNGEKGGTDGDSTNARFNNPWGIELSQRGTVYIGDSNNGVIRKIARDRTVTTFAGNSTVSGQSALRFSRPMGLDLAVDGYIYVADALNHVIKRVSLDGLIEPYAGLGLAGDVDGDRFEARFSIPADVAVSKTSIVVYVADAFNNKIKVITPDGTVQTLAGVRSGGFADGPASEARFAQPLALALSQDEEILYVSDFFNHSIRTVDTRTGEVQTLAGNGTPGYVDGPLEDARFNRPVGITVSHEGTIFVADSENHVIRKIEDGTVSTFAGTGAAGMRNGEGSEAQFNLPYHIIISQSGGTLMYVADRRNNLIRRILIE